MSRAQRQLVSFPLVLASILAVVKSVYVGSFLGANQDWTIYLFPLRNDLPILGLIGFFSFAAALFTSRLLARFSLVVGTLAATWYSIDTGVLLAVNFRAPISEMMQYAIEWRAYSDIAINAGLFLLLAGYVLYSRFLRFTIIGCVPGLVVCLLLMFLPSEVPFATLDSYSTPILSGRAGRNFFATSAPHFTQEELKGYQASKPIASDAVIDPQQRDVVLIVIESWTSGDSLATSGLRNLTPALDKLGEQGMLFTRFFANGGNTEQGLVSLLSGSAPLQFPGHSLSHYRSFAHGDSFVQALHHSGYTTEFMSSATLLFRNKNFFLDSLGFNLVLGLENVPEFQQAERFTFDAPADAVLYQRAGQSIARLSAQQAPYFMMVETTTSHLPYLDPKKGENTEERVWNYVDTECVAFVESLRAGGFFENGIVIVTSDHRKMLPATAQEIALYGDSVQARIPLVIVGKGIPAGVRDDRQFQQSDLLRRLAVISDPNRELSPLVLHAQPHYAPFFWGDNPATVGVYGAPNSSLRQALTWGAQLTWRHPVPPLAQRGEAESQLRRLFARRQVCSQGGC